MIALPPFDAGAVKLTVAAVFPAVAAPIVGAPGAVRGTIGVTLLEAADAGPVPAELVAVTVNVYAVPFVSPVTVSGLAAPVAVMLPGLEVTVYDVTVLPAGAVKVIVACALPATAVAPVGAPGITTTGDTGVALLDGFDAALVPRELAAVTVKV